MVLALSHIRPPIWRRGPAPPPRRPGRVRGTWDEPKQAAAWLGEQLAACAYRFASEGDRDTARLSRLVDAAAADLGSGADVSYGHYLERPTYLSLAVVTRSPNRALPELPCPGV